MGICGALGFGQLACAADIAHDAEYYILEAQNGEKWAAEDKLVDQKLAALPRMSPPASAQGTVLPEVFK